VSLSPAKKGALLSLTGIFTLGATYLPHRDSDSTQASASRVDLFDRTTIEPREPRIAFNRHASESNHNLVQNEFSANVRQFRHEQHSQKAPDFARSLQFVLSVEGGVSSNRHDRANRNGKVTIEGITERAYHNYRKNNPLPWETLSQIPKNEFPEIRDRIYRTYWEDGKCSEMPAALATLHFDTCVNMGVQGAGKILQRALNKLDDSSPALKEDGKVGELTLARLKNSAEDKLIDCYLELRRQRYTQIARRGNNAVFANGWENRLQALEAHLNEAN